MKKIYIVTSGEYSDYGINGVFETKELAQAYIEMLGNPKGWSSEMQVEEHDLNPYKNYIKEGLKPFLIFIHKNGNVTKAEIAQYGLKPSTTISFSYNKSQMIVFCWAKDKQHAIKIANEKRAKIIALNQWANIQLTD